MCEHMKIIRSSQASISINYCTELSKTQFFPVSIVKKLGGFYCYPCGTVVLTFGYSKYWKFKITCSLQIWCCFNTIPSRQTLLNSFQISRNTLFFPKPSSKEVNISFVIDSRPAFLSFIVESHLFLRNLVVIFEVFNPFDVTGLFKIPPRKHQKNQRFPDVFRVYIKKTLAWNGWNRLSGERRFGGEQEFSVLVLYMRIQNCVEHQRWSVLQE